MAVQPAHRVQRISREADARLARGEGGPLTGVPIAHKDIFCTDGILTTCGSRMLGNFVAPYDATVVARWRSAGTVLLGKTNMDEFAMGSSNETSFFGPVRNPWDPARVPGGSSGGSAAAVAARLAPAASGTDTGGSIRQPAALTNLTGLKPTYGRLSRAGSFPFVDAFDHLGPLARSAEDLALSFDAMQGWDPDDPVCTDRDIEPTVPTLHEGIGGLRIAVAGDYFAKGGEPKSFTVNSVVAKPATKSTLSAMVFIKDKQAAYLALEETGGTREPKGTALVLPGSEAADLLFHLLVLFREKGLPLADVWAEMDERFGRAPRPGSTSPPPSRASDGS